VPVEPHEILTADERSMKEELFRVLRQLEESSCATIERTTYVAPGTDCGRVAPLASAGLVVRVAGSMVRLAFPEMYVTSFHGHEVVLWS